MESHFEISEEWEVADDAYGLLQVGPCELFIFLSVLFCDFDLFEVTDTK